jgi:phage terminase large subunit-like protein
MSFASILDAIEYDWDSQARPEQRAPAGDWATWVYCGGRGTGKTRAGAEWVRSLAEAASVARIALVAPTASDARDVMVEGESGLLAIAPNSNRPVYEPSKRRLTWPNGVQAALFSSEEPERLRGPQHGAAWADELAAWRNVKDTWSNLQFGLRLGKRPRQVVTTTPKPIPILRALIKDTNTVVTRGTTYDNRDNLAPSFFSQIVKQYEGTRLGRQELNAEILDDVPGALWTREMIERAREPAKWPTMTRIVVAVDPSGARGTDDTGADTIGIVVAGRGDDGRGWVLADRSLKASPAVWGRAAVEAYRDFRADRIVAERNFGGAMVEHVIRTADPNVAFSEVIASRGKVLRCEPIAALYEQGRISHTGDMALLEEQMCAMASDGYMGDGSPDRVDALVWALTELMLSTTAVLNISRETAAAFGAAMSDLGRRSRMGQLRGFGGFTSLRPSEPFRQPDLIATVRGDPI